MLNRLPPADRERASDNRPKSFRPLTFIHTSYDHMHQNLNGQPSYQRPRRKGSLSPSAVTYLEQTFEQNVAPDPATRLAIAQELDMTPRAVKVWFQNRRKTKAAEIAETDDPKIINEIAASMRSCSNGLLQFMENLKQAKEKTGVWPTRASITRENNIRKDVVSKGFIEYLMTKNIHNIKFLCNPLLATIL
jgi:hypothetical protein